jgi:hypothetical protein
MHIGIWWGKLKVMYPLEDLSIDMCIILKLILKKDWEVMGWINIV